MKRIIPVSPTSTGLLQELRQRLVEVDQISYGTSAADARFMTSTAGAAVSVARADHVHLLRVPTLSAPAGRTTSTVYTNNGTGPMWIGVSMALSAPGALGAHLIVNNTHVAHADGNANIHFFLMGIANPGEQYILTATGGVNIEHWVEYQF